MSDARAGNAMLSKHWLEIKIEPRTAEVWIEGRGSREESPAPHSLGPSFHMEALCDFTRQIGDTLCAERTIDPALRSTAQRLHAALFQGELRDVFIRLREACGGEPLLVRFSILDRTLQAIPWEAACEPGTSEGFLGCDPGLLVARRVSTSESLQSREVLGAVRMLVIAPEGEATLEKLKAALRDRMASGEIDWLEPIVGNRASPEYLFSELRQRQSPHVIHFIGHGGMDSEGNPTLDLSAGSVRPPIKAEALARELQAAFARDLRLLFLEASNGAMPGALGSAAEIFARAGAAAVVAHLWPVYPEVAATGASTFYDALAGTARPHGDVAASLGAARRQVLVQWNNAEVFTPVLYLRGGMTRLFDFEGRKVKPPVPARAQAQPGRPLDASLSALFDGSFSLVLGDVAEEQSEGRQALRAKLESSLAKAPKGKDAPSLLPLSTIAQRYVLRSGRAWLTGQCEQLLRELSRSSPTTPVPFIDLLAQKLGPGVHTTLCWMPVLEQALAQRRPDLTLYAVQLSSPPAAENAMILRRAAHASSWEAPEPGDLPPPDLTQDIVVLRLHGGLSPESDLGIAGPLLTEDDYIEGLMRPEDALPKDWVEPVLASIRSARRLLLGGMSILKWRHRMVLRWVCGERALPQGSVVLLGPDVDPAESEIWASGKGWSRGKGVRVIQETGEALARWVDEHAAARAGA